MVDSAGDVFQFILGINMLGQVESGMARSELVRDLAADVVIKGVGGPERKGVDAMCFGVLKERGENRARVQAAADGHHMGLIWLEVGRGCLPL